MKRIDENRSAREVLTAEVREAVKEMKSGKAPGLDLFPVECLKKGVCKTKWRSVRGSGVFQVPGIASGSRWRMWKRCGTQNE